MTVDSAVVAPSETSVWSPKLRFCFRFSLFYFFCYLFAFGNGSLLDLFPYVGGWITTAIEWPFHHVSTWLAVHLFHLRGVKATFHPTGSGDTPVQWIMQGVFLVFAFVGACLWTGISEKLAKRQEYATLYSWLRFTLRLSCAMFMFFYGTAKLFPMQMAEPSIAILNEPVGNISPMTLLWISIGLHPAYEVVCGAAEVVGGLLLLFRRTALAGALLSAFVMTNVLLYNLFFDVPVKIFAANLLLALLFLCLDDFKALWRFFWKHEAATASALWAPRTFSKRARITARSIEIVYTLAIAIFLTGFEGYSYLQSRKHAAKPSDLLGAWHVVSNTNSTKALVSPEGKIINDLYVDSATRAFSRDAEGELWRTHLEADKGAKSVSVRVYVGSAQGFAYSMPDAQHLILDSKMPKQDGKQPKKSDKESTAYVPAHIELVRTPVASHYALLDRPFHWTNDWGYER